MSLIYTAAVYELLKKKSRLFSFGSNNAFLEFFLEGVPGITQTHVDSKKVHVHCKMLDDRYVHVQYIHVNVYTYATQDEHRKICACTHMYMYIYADF